MEDKYDEGVDPLDFDTKNVLENETIDPKTTDVDLGDDDESDDVEVQSELDKDAGEVDVEAAELEPEESLEVVEVKVKDQDLFEGQEEPELDVEMSDLSGSSVGRRNVDKHLNKGKDKDASRGRGESQKNPDKGYGQNKNNGGEDGDNGRKDNGGRGRRAGGGRAMTKVVIRRLPPRMTKNEFIEAVQPLPEHNFLTFNRPDKEWGISGRSVAHINFLDEKDASWFMDRFTGYRFLDLKGNEYISVCDLSVNHVIPIPTKKGKVNKKRGTLAETEHYRAFVKKIEEDYDSVFTVLPNNGALVTPEIMLTELEDRTQRNRDGLVPIPLVDFIMKNRSISRRDKDTKVRRDRDRPITTNNSEKKEGSRYRDRDINIKRERKRDKRDKERKDRRGKEKFENDPKSKGSLVTYSKTGKVTRWSANSSPLVKKSSESEATEQAALDLTSKEKPESKVEKPDIKVDVKKKMFNPFSVESGKKFVAAAEDKSKFCKPFPVKPKSDDKGGKAHSSSTSVVEEVPKNVSDKVVPGVSANQGSRYNKVDSSDKFGSETKGKTIVKKIVRVRRVVPNSSQGNSTANSQGGGDKKEQTNVISRKPPAHSKDSKSEADSRDSFKSKDTETKHINKDREPKGAAEIKGNQESSFSENDSNPKRQRARPDMQIYRPGSLRSSGSSKTAANYSSSKVTGDGSSGSSKAGGNGASESKGSGNGSSGRASGNGSSGRASGNGSSGSYKGSGNGNGSYRNSKPSGSGSSGFSKNPKTTPTSDSSGTKSINTEKTIKEEA